MTITALALAGTIARRQAVRDELGRDRRAAARRPAAVRSPRASCSATLLGVDALGPAVGGTTALLAFLGGVWFPIGDGFLHDVAQALPSYWLTQASRVASGGAGWSALGWVVTAAWTVVAERARRLGIPP